MQNVIYLITIMFPMGTGLLFLLAPQRVVKAFREANDLHGPGTTAHMWFARLLGLIAVATALALLAAWIWPDPNPAPFDSVMI